MKFILNTIYCDKGGLPYNLELIMANKVPEQFPGWLNCCVTKKDFIGVSMDKVSGRSEFDEKN